MKYVIALCIGFIIAIGLQHIGWACVTDEMKTIDYASFDLLNWIVTGVWFTLILSLSWKIAKETK